MAITDDKEKGRKGGSMVAPHPLRPVEDLAAERGVSAPVLAGIRRAKGWADGKQVTAVEFGQAVEAFEKRPMGGGKL